MPRPRKQNSLDARVSALALHFGGALVHAVRDELASEVSRLVNGAKVRNGATRSSSAAKKGRPLQRGSVNERVLAKLLGVIKTSPGLRSEQIYEKVNMSKKLAKAGLAKLREMRKVKIKGQKRAASYTVA